MKKTDVVIIGAGAAGLMCAIEAGKRGRTVLVIDHANKAGKKILMSGGGRCNFTNKQVSDTHFISHNARFCRSALSRYTPEHFIDWVTSQAIPFHEKTRGQLFCDHKSSDILAGLLQECDAVSVDIQLNTSVNAISQQSNKRFVLNTSHGDVDAQSLVVATGGLSIPTMGASPFGYQIAEQFGLAVCPTHAGLVPFTLHVPDKEKFASLSGVSVACLVSCHKRSFREDMLFTHRGLSGPAMLQISSYWHPGDVLTINLLPEIILLEELMAAKEEQPTMTLKTFFSQHLPNRLVAVWLGETLKDTLQSYSFKRLQVLADLFQRWQIKPNGTEGYRTAEVTLGGVDCRGISSKTFEANKVTGLYFIGEVLDVAGWLGGYNFQWAWSSGFVAGQVV
jgi:predicted Rossmann fold flavoprotein